MPPRDLASTLGTCAALIPRGLHVRRWSYRAETGLPKGRPLALHLEDMQGASADCTARQRLALQAGGYFGPPGTRPAPLGLALIPAQGACTCGAPQNHKKLASTCTAPLALAGRVSHLRRKAESAAACRKIPCPARDTASTLETCAAFSRRRLHVWRTPLPTENWPSLARYLWHLQGA